MNARTYINTDAAECLSSREQQKTAPLRLAYLISRYPAVSHAFILREVLSLRELGHDIQVASINPPDRPLAAMTQAEQAEAARTYVVKQVGVVTVLKAHAFTLCLSSLAYLRGLAAALRLGGTDLKKLLYSLFYFVEAVVIGRWMTANRLRHLHVHFATPAATAALIATRIFPITFSLTVHGPDEFFDIPGYRLAEKIAGASFVCCIGSYARSQLMSLAPSVQWPKFELAPLGVDLAAFTPRPFRAHPRPFTILCVGRLVPVKGQLILLAACARLSQTGREIRVCLVGAGPDRGALEAEAAAQGIRDHVRFAGAVNQDAIRALYAEADVFVSPSFAEGIPVVLMEAMAMEIPCVATWITGVPELIRHQRDGVLVPPGDVEALAEALAQLMDDAALRHGLGRAGRRRVEEKYNLQRNTARLAEIFARRLRGDE